MTTAVNCWLQVHATKRISVLLLYSFLFLSIFFYFFVICLFRGQGVESSKLQTICLRLNDANKEFCHFCLESGRNCPSLRFDLPFLFGFFLLFCFKLRSLPRKKKTFCLGSNRLSHCFLGMKVSLWSGYAHLLSFALYITYWPFIRQTSIPEIPNVSFLFLYLFSKMRSNIESLTMHRQTLFKWRQIRLERKDISLIWRH